MAESVDFSKIGLEWGYQGKHGSRSLNPKQTQLIMFSNLIEYFFKVQ